MLLILSPLLKPNNIPKEKLCHLSNRAGMEGGEKNMLGDERELEMGISSLALGMNVKATKRQKQTKNPRHG